MHGENIVSSSDLYKKYCIRTRREDRFATVSLRRRTTCPPVHLSIVSPRISPARILRTNTRDFSMASISRVTHDSRHRATRWIRAKRIARDDVRPAMSYRAGTITPPVIYDCISVPFGRRRYIMRIPPRREFIYSIIIAYNR